MATRKPVTLRDGIVYIVRRDYPSGASFKEGDRVVLARPQVEGAKSAEFKRADGSRVPCPFVNAEDLAYANPADGKPAKKLTRKDIKPGVVYVLLEDQPDGSTFMKGDRVKLFEGAHARPMQFTREDGRAVPFPFVSPKYLAFADQKDATMPAPKPPMMADIRHGVTYVTLLNNPSCSGFLKGERIRLKPGSRPLECIFERVDGRPVQGPYVNPQFLAIADEKEVTVAAKLTRNDIVPDAIYVVLTDRPCGSSFRKGDRIKLSDHARDTNGPFNYEDGREAAGPYVGPEFLAFADGGVAAKEAGSVFRRALMTDLKPGAVFKVEGATGWHSIPLGSLVKHTGAFSDGTNSPHMQMLVTEGTGKRQYIRLEDMVLVIPGSGDVARPKPKSGSGKTIKSASRSDGFTFLLKDCGEDGYLMEAGCRWFTMAEAEKHWTETRLGTDLGNETFDILRLFNEHIIRLEAKKKKGA